MPRNFRVKIRPQIAEADTFLDSVAGHLVASRSRIAAIHIGAAPWRHFTRSAAVNSTTKSGAMHSAFPTVDNGSPMVDVSVEIYSVWVGRRAYCRGIPPCPISVPYFASRQPFSLTGKHCCMLSNEPTAFSVALADSGERTRRLRCRPFLRNSARTILAVARKI